jgi:hypothetical protein
VLSGLFAISYGSYLGILLFRKTFGIMEVDMFKTSIWKMLLRYLIMIIMGLPFGAMLLFIPSDSKLGILIIFQTLIPAFCFGLIGFYFV